MARQYRHTSTLIRVVTALVVAAHVSSVGALSVAITLKQTQHTAWDLQDGAPSNITEITQTSDGFLWLGSTRGLYRFDGQSFSLYSYPLDPETNWDVTALTAAENNDLWVGSRRLGVVHLHDGKLVYSYSVSEGLPRSTVYSIRKDSRSNIWEASSAGVFTLVGSRWIRAWPESGASPRPAANLLMDRTGSVCFTTDGAVFCKGAGDASFTQTLAGEVEDLGVSSAGMFWVWLSGIGMKPLLEGSGQSPAITSKILHGHMVFDRSGALWVITYGHALARYSEEAATNHSERNVWRREDYDLQDGLQSRYLNCVFGDREGNIWVGTTKGLERFRVSKLVSVPVLGASPSTVLLPLSSSRMWAGQRTISLGIIGPDNQWTPITKQILGVTSAFLDRDGSAWFGSSPKLWHIKNGATNTIDLPKYVQGSSDIQAITRDQDGALWVSVVRFGMFRFENNKWVRFDSGTGAPTEYANVLYTDNAGRLWIGYHGRVILVEGTRRTVVGSHEGPNFGDILCFASHGSILWAGGEHGLALYEGDRFVRIHTTHDDLLEGISGLVFSSDGSLWIHSSKALLRLSPEQLEIMQSDRRVDADVQVFSFQDGLPGMAPLVRPLPTAALGNDGRIWVTTTSGVAWIDPMHYPKNSLPPTIALQSVRADGREYQATGTLALAARTHSVAFNYTAPALSVADGIHFRYRLEGFDSDWQDAGSRRTAFYTNLPPGNYRFQVIAGNEDDVWNDTGSSVAIGIAPAFYQRLSFRIFCWAVGAIALWIGYRTRIRLLTERVRDLLAERLTERERIATELHDTLLQSVQGLILLFHGISVQMPKDDPLTARVDGAIDRAEQLLEEGRDSVRDLRSTSFSLEEAFANLGSEFRDTDTHYVVNVRGQQPELQLLVCDEVFKLGREAIRNALQHAEATTVEVSLSFKPHVLELEIRDDGKGLSRDILEHGRPGHWGLLGMRERAHKLRALFEITSRVGRGTTVNVRMPATVAYRHPMIGLRSLLGMLVGHIYKTS